MFNKLIELGLCMAPDGAEGGGTGTEGAQSGAGGDGGSGGTGGADGAAVELPKSQEELTKFIQTETEKALKNSEEKLQKDYEAKLEAEKAEATRLAKLSSEEKEKELEKKKKEELDQREATIKNQELTLKATDLLTSKGLPLEIRALVIGKDETETTSRIDAFAGVFQKAVEAAVNQKLSQSAKPGAGTGTEENVTLRNQIAAGLRE